MTDKINEPWPVADLESVPNCPVCRGSERELMYKHLTDCAFHVAPGEWTLYRCRGCHCAYLDPRPSPHSIARAYLNYYTHQAPENPNVRRSKSAFRTLFRGMLNDYINHRYKMSRRPAKRAGRWVIRLISPLRSRGDCELRHLPKKDGQMKRVLDVGCGNGQYLLLAREAGWEVEGVDFDVDAVLMARNEGLNVQVGGIEVLPSLPNRYDVITLSHLIEHVYDPTDLLRKCYFLLKPGGMLWLETPNIESWLSRIYRENWRGLETPRHLSIFNAKGLEYMLENAGFKKISHHYKPGVKFMYEESSRILKERSNDIGVRSEAWMYFRNFVIEVAEFFVRSRREFILITSVK